MSYDKPGPYVEGRVVNATDPSAKLSAKEPCPIEDALRQYDALREKYPEASFRVEKRMVYVEPWEVA